MTFATRFAEPHADVYEMHVPLPLASTSSWMINELGSAAELQGVPDACGAPFSSAAKPADSSLPSPAAMHGWS